MTKSKADDNISSMDEKHIRLECLKLTNNCVSPAESLARAKMYESYILGKTDEKIENKKEETPKVEAQPEKTSKGKSKKATGNFNSLI